MEAWNVATLKELCVVDWGNTDLTKSSYVEDGDFLAVSAAGCDGRIGHKEHSKGTPVLSAIGAQCGKMFFPDEDFTAIKNTITLTPRPEVCLGRFLYYLLTFVELPKRGAGQPFISKGDIQSFVVSYPSLPEQHRIVAILDEAFEAIATAKANTEKNLQNAREVFDSHVEQVLSRRQGHWLDCKLGDLCQVKTGKKDVNQGNPEGRFPFFTCAAQHTYSDSFSFDTEALLIAGNGNVGQVTYYSGKFEAYQRTYVLSSFKGVDARYLFRVLDKRLSAKVSKQKLGNTMPYIKVGMLTDFVVPVPSQAEQRRITEELESIADETERLEALYVTKSEALIELKKSLLHQAFTGQLTAKTTDKQLAEVA